MIIGDQEPKSTKKKKRPRQKKPDEIQKPLCIKLKNNEFDSLRQDVYNNLNINKFKTTVNKKTYDLKNSKKVFVENNYLKN